jgi:hypothetical protein
MYIPTDQLTEEQLKALNNIQSSDNWRWISSASSGGDLVEDAEMWHENDDGRGFMHFDNNNNPTGFTYYNTNEDPDTGLEASDWVMLSFKPNDMRFIKSLLGQLNDLRQTHNLKWTVSDYNDRAKDIYDKLVALNNGSYNYERDNLSEKEEDDSFSHTYRLPRSTEGIKLSDEQVKSIFGIADNSRLLNALRGLHSY